MDEAIKRLVGGDVLVSKEGVFIKENGHYRATAPLDIDNQKMENLPDPLDEKDAVNKKYIDGIVEALTLKQGLVRENGGFNLVDSYINMNFNNIRNVGYPQHNEDAVPRSFVDDIEKTIIEKMGKLPQLIAVHARYCGPLKEGEYPFKFGGNSLEICEEVLKQSHSLKSIISGFVMPHSGRIKKIICEGVTYIEIKKIVDKIINLLKEEQINELKKHFGKEDFKSDLLKKILFNVEFYMRNYEGKTFFQIIKIEKDFSLKTFSQYVVERFIVIENFNHREIEMTRITEIIAIMKLLNYDIVPLKEGETINIRISDFQQGISSEGDLMENILQTTVLRLISSLNFNFTFLIELDPL